MALFLLLFSSFSLLVTSVSLSFLLRQHSHPARFLLSVISGWVVIGYLTLLACGLLHALRSDAVTLVSFLLALVLLWLTRTEWYETLVKPFAGSPAALQQERAVSISSSVVPCFMALAILVYGLHWLREAITGPTVLSYDDLWYHLFCPTLWLKNQSIDWVPPDQLFTWQFFFPAGSELIASWFALPFQGSSRGDSLAWASVTGWIYILMILCSTVDITRRITKSKWAWMLPAVMCLSSKTLLGLTNYYGNPYADTDLAQFACTLAALCFALPVQDREEPETVWRDGGYAACLLGMILAIKMSAIATVPIITLIWLSRLWIASKLQDEKPLFSMRRAYLFLLGCGMFVGVGFLLAGYWYLRNYWVTGNPLFPAKILGLPGITFERNTLAEFFAVHGFRAGWREVYRVYCDWPQVHGILALGGLLLQVPYLILCKPKLSRTAWIISGSFLLLAVTQILSLPNMPFSSGTASTFDSGRIFAPQVRFIGLLPILGWISWGWLIDPGSRSNWRDESALLIAAICITAGGVFPGPVHSAFYLIVALWVIALLFARLGSTKLGAYSYRCWNQYGSRITVTGTLCVALAAMSFVVLNHNRKAMASESLLENSKHFGTLVQQLEKLPAGEAITIYGTRYHYLLFGEHWQFEPVRLNAKGERPQEWQEALFDTEQTTSEKWCAEVEKSGVSIIVFLSTGSAKGKPNLWSQEYDWIKSCPRAELKFEDENASIWRLKPAGK